MHGVMICLCVGVQCPLLQAGSFASRHYAAVPVAVCLRQLKRHTVCPALTAITHVHVQSCAFVRLQLGQVLPAPSWSLEVSREEKCVHCWCCGLTVCPWVHLATREFTRQLIRLLCASHGAECSSKRPVTELSAPLSGLLS
jgi:hypothetical protein